MIFIKTKMFKGKGAGCLHTDSWYRVCVGRAWSACQKNKKTYYCTMVKNIKITSINYSIYMYIASLYMTNPSLFKQHHSHLMCTCHFLFFQTLNWIFLCKERTNLVRLHSLSHPSTLSPFNLFIWGSSSLGEHTLHSAVYWRHQHILQSNHILWQVMFSRPGLVDQ